MLKKGLHWRRLPKWARKTLQDGVARVEEQHRAIAASAKVQWMPPVDCLSVAWLDPSFSASLDGRATWLRRNGHNVIGVELPAQTLAYRSDRLLRGVLVHEFSHCFRQLEIIVAHLDSGATGMVDFPQTEDVLRDESFEDALHVVPGEWFGPDDVDTFIHWNDERIQDEYGDFIGRWLDADAPYETPDLEFHIEHAVLPEEILAHARTVGRPLRAE